LLCSISEGLISSIAESGIETPDHSLITLCIVKAEEIGTIFDHAVDSGFASLDSFFDQNYTLIPHSNPEQYMTRFVKITDELLPPVQEPLLKADPRIVFCAAVDRNGYLPTHNLEYSKPRTHDPVWNAFNCRNRRLFNDRTGFAAGCSQKPFLLQTYRRDMGGGEYILMKDLSAPIKVKGRHWGALRMGYRAVSLF
jgi:methyl-accepting chemotaxis protein